jgi:hypothetical protein
VGEDKEADDEEDKVVKNLKVTGNSPRWIYLNKGNGYND